MTTGLQAMSIASDCQSWPARYLLVFTDATAPIDAFEM